MKRHPSRIIPTALAAVLVLGACGSADDDGDAIEAPTDQTDDVSDGLRAPTPIEFTSGSGGGDARVAAGTSEAAIAADDMSMIAPYFQIEYILGDGLVLPTDDTGWVFDRSGTLTADQVAQLATALGVEGEPVSTDDGFTVSWRVGPDDGTAPSLWISDDAQQYWNYNSAWALQTEDGRFACAVSVDSEGNETVEDCPEPEPPVGVPTAEQAEARAADLLSAIGVDPSTVTFETYADEWFASVNANDTTDQRTNVVSWGFGFGAEGVLQYAGGPLARPEAVGPYPLIDLETAFQRLQDQSFGGVFRGGLDTPAIATAEEAPVDLAVEPDVMESGEPAAEPVTDDGVAIDEPMPIDGTIPEPEIMTVTLVDVQPDLWWAWDVDGSVWLLPAYRFIGDDGGWYTVPAVTDEYLIQVDPPIAIEEPMPVEPGDGTGEPGVVEPGEPGEPTDGGTVDPAEPTLDPAVIAPLVGGRFDEFIAAAEAAGWTVRVVERDGESLPVTEDFSLTRVNVAVVTVDGVEQVVRATTDDGTLVAEVTIEPTEPTEQALVPLSGVFEGVAFYPACGSETVVQDGTTYVQVDAYSWAIDPKALAPLLGAARETSPLADSLLGFAPRVAEPGPGDDIGTLVIWQDGVGEFRSDSGVLQRILVTQAILDALLGDQLVEPPAC